MSTSHSGIICHAYAILVTISLRTGTKFGMSTFTRSKDMTGPQDLKMGHVTLTTPFLGWFLISQLILAMAYRTAKFEDSSFTRSKNMKEDPNGLLRVAEGHQHHRSVAPRRLPKFLFIPIPIFTFRREDVYVFRFPHTVSYLSKVAVFF